MQDFRPTLLHHVLELVPFDGWSEFTLKEAARLSGLGEAELSHAFAGGITDCLRYYIEQVDEQMEQQCPADLLASKRTPERIEMLVMARLSVMLPHREAVRRAASASLLPWNSTDAVRSLFSMTDRMWRLAGDRSTDFNFYTKRMTLAGVYVSTFLFWLNDSSPQLEATKLFLKRRLSEVATFGKKKKEIIGLFTSFYQKKTL